jgi:hypothetical protein
MDAKRRIFLLAAGLGLLAGCADPSYSDGVYQPSGYYQQPSYGRTVYGQPDYPPPAYYPGYYASPGYYSGSSSYRVIERAPEHGQRVYREPPPPQRQQQVQQQTRPQVQIQPPPPRDPGCGPGGRRNCEFGSGQNGK